MCKFLEILFSQRRARTHFQTRLADLPRSRLASDSIGMYDEININCHMLIILDMLVGSPQSGETAVIKGNCVSGPAFSPCLQLMQGLEFEV